MATLESLQFEMERRVILFKPTTTMPDNSQLGYNGDPNDITSPSTPGELLLYFSPNGTRYLEYDVSDNVIVEWFKKAQPNGWIPAGEGGSPLGTDSSTWQLNMANNGVILQDDNSNLIIKSYDGSLATLVVGSLVIDNITGILRAIDGSIFADPSVGLLLTGVGIIPGDATTKDFLLEHGLSTLNHVTTVYDMSNNVVYAGITIGANTDQIKFHTPPDSSVDHRIVIMGF